MYELNRFSKLNLLHDCERLRDRTADRPKNIDRSIQILKEISVNSMFRAIHEMRLISQEKTVMIWHRDNLWWLCDSEDPGTMSKIQVIINMPINYLCHKCIIYLTNEGWALYDDYINMIPPICFEPIECQGSSKPFLKRIEE